MKKANRKPVKLGGAVLIMVLTVMFVLIFLLAGTIAVVYSANNRAMMKYQESQAYYTARSVLDTYIETMLADNTNSTGANSSDAITYVHLNPAGTTPATSNYNAKIGRALELDIYKLAVDLDNSTAGMQTSYSDIQSYLNTVGNSPDSPTDPTYEKVPNWVKLYILEIIKGTDDVNTILNGADPTTANINAQLGASRLSDSAGYQQACKIAVAAINPTSSEFPAGSADAYYDQFEIGTSETIEYTIDNVTMGAYGDDTSSGRMGKLFDAGTDIKLEVKLLERKYHNMVTDGVTAATFFDRFTNGNREKDYVKIKITSTITYDGEKFSTSVEYKTKYDPKPSNDSALTSLGGISSSSSGFSIAGGMTSLKPDQIALNASNVSGSVFTEGSIDSQTSGTMKLVDNAHFVVKGDYQVSNSLNIEATGDKSYFYVAGKVHGDRQYTFGTAGSQPIDVLCGEFECTNNPYTVSGNLYTDVMHLEYGDSKVIPNIQGVMYANDIIIDAPNTVNGNKGKQNVYDVQDLGGGIFQVNVSDFAADEVHAGRVIVKNYYTVDPDPSVVLPPEDVDKGITKLDLILNLNSSQVVIVNSGGRTTLNPANADHVKLDYFNPDHFTVSSQYKKKIVMPDGKEFELDTARTRFEQYYGEDAFEKDESGANAGYFGDFLHSKYYTADAATGELNIDETKIKDVSNGDIESAESQARKLTGGNTCVLSNAVTLSGNTTLGPGNYILNAYTNQNANITVDTTNGNVTMQLSQGGGDYFGNFNVIGEGEFNLLIPEDGNTYSLGNSGYDFSVTYDKTNLSGGGTVYVGSESSGVTLTAPPQVNLYIGGESGLKVCRNSFVTGYVYGPRAKVEVVTDAQGRTLTYNQSGTTVSTSKYWLAGSVVCGEYSNNNVGVAFISSDQSNVQPGDKVFGWLDVLYTRPEAK